MDLTKFARILSHSRITNSVELETRGHTKGADRSSSQITHLKNPLDYKSQVALRDEFYSLNLLGQQAYLRTGVR